MHQYRDAMSRALFLANRAASAGDVPVGAVVLDSMGRVVGEGWNIREADHDPCGHAEVLALRQAGARLKRWNLVGCTLVVTVEPCTMCAGAAVAARVDRVVFGVWEPKTGAAGSVRDVLRDSRLGHDIEVIPGVLASEASVQMKAFFEERRRRESLKSRIPAALPARDCVFSSGADDAGRSAGVSTVVAGSSDVEDAAAEFAQMAASVKVPVLDNVEWDEAAQKKFGSLPHVPELTQRPRYRSLSDEELRVLDEQRRQRERELGVSFELPHVVGDDGSDVVSDEVAQPGLVDLPQDLQSIIAGIALRKQRMQ